jgi:uncharacterized protein (DUF2141 family)
MHGFFTFLLGWFSLLPALANAQAGAHTVIIKNLNKKLGNIYIGWYDSEKAFMDGNHAVLKKIVSVKDENEVAVKFEQVNPGIYAIAVFFDQNGNGRLDKNFLGIPREEYGFSNNIIPLTRSATFKEASFTINTVPETIVIKVK